MAAVRDNELYSKGYQINLPDGRSLLKRDKPVYVPLANRDRTVIIRDGDTPWALAYKFLGDDKKYFNILDANSIFNPFELTSGVELVIPDIDVVKVGQ